MIITITRPQSQCSDGLSEKHIFCKEEITDKNTLLYMIYVKYNMGIPDGSVVKNPPASAGDSGEEGLIPG